MAAVYKAINKVQSDLAKIGIAKDRKNMQGKGGGYNFRGIDDVYNALSPLLAEHGLCILPRMLSRKCKERTSASGGSLFFVTVEAEFDLVSAEDGSIHVIRTFGEAFDSGDKATNKAMSAAYKYAAFQAFSIPTEGDNDADAHTHEIAVKRVSEYEADEIKDLLRTTGSNVSDFLKWLGCDADSVEAIPATYYKRAINALMKKAEKAKGTE